MSFTARSRFNFRRATLTGRLEMGRKVILTPLGRLVWRLPALLSLPLIHIIPNWMLVARIENRKAIGDKIE